VTVPVTLAAAGAVSFPVLPALILVPLLGALLVIVMPRRRPELLKLVAVSVSVVTGAMSVWLFTAFDTGVTGFQFGTEQVWIRDLGISWLLGIDGISLFLVTTFSSISGPVTRVFRFCSSVMPKTSRVSIPSGS